MSPVFGARFLWGAGVYTFSAVTMLCTLKWLLFNFYNYNNTIWCLSKVKSEEGPLEAMMKFKISPEA
jgi:hypothetical protein